MAEYRYTGPWIPEAPPTGCDCDWCAWKRRKALENRLHWNPSVMGAEEKAELMVLRAFAEEEEGE